MDTDRRTISPARRSKRCVRWLFILCILVAGAYVGHPPSQWNGSVGVAANATPERNLSSASTASDTSKKGHQPSAPVQLTLVDTILPVTQPAKDY
jgi:hypothetical protein